MKKLMLYCLICFSLPFAVLSQTEELEIQSIRDRLQSGKITQEEYAKLGKEWQNLIKELGGYPKLPYNEEKGEIEFLYFSEFEKINKEAIFKRIKEWAAINFGSLSAVLHYEDLESGKIILKGNFDVLFPSFYRGLFGKERMQVDLVTSYQTYVFTVKENKVKLEIIGLEYDYEVYFFGEVSGSRKQQRPIGFFLPITEGDPEDWKERLFLIQATESKILSLFKSLKTYIAGIEEDYKF